MIYLVSNQTQLFESTAYSSMSVEESLDTISKWGCIQYDSETNGRSSRLCTLLCVQFGNKKADTQIVVDCTTINICLYKHILEKGKLIGHNLRIKFQP